MMMNKVYCNFVKPNNGYLNNSVDLENVIISGGVEVKTNLVDAWFMSGCINYNTENKGEKGNILNLKNFTWEKESGYGGYPLDWTKLFNNSIYIDNLYVLKPFSYIENYKVSDLSKDLTYTLPKFRIEVEGVFGNFYLMYFDIYWNQQIIYEYYNGDEKYEKKIHTIPEKKWVYDEYLGNDYDWNHNVYIQISIADDKYDCIMKILPEYPGTLVFNGINNYCHCPTIKVPEYTIITKQDDSIKVKTGTNLNGFYLGCDTITGDVVNNPLKAQIKYVAIYNEKLSQEVINEKVLELEKEYNKRLG